MAAKRPVVDAPPPSARPHPTSSEQRVRQQELLAELGVLALKGVPFEELLERTATIVAVGLRAEFSKVMEYLPSDRRFLVRAGVGWPEDVVQNATIGADLASPAGYALSTGEPVISNHLGKEHRFRTPELLLDHGVRRAINVIIQGDGVPYGVLEVDSRNAGEFSPDDLAFLQGAANMLGLAIERQKIERSLHFALEHQKLLIREISHRVNNSLQLVTGMLHLQASAAEDDRVRQQLQEASTRIHAVARVHDRLYRNDRIDTIDLADYLTLVCRDLEASIPNASVAVRGTPELSLSADQAVPCALLVGELALNAAKHAYKGGRCSVVVTAEPLGDGRIRLSVADEGDGLPPDFNINGDKGLGMRIVRSFARKLDADIVVQRLNPGTEFSVTFRPGE